MIEAVVATIVFELFNHEIDVVPVAPLMLTLAVPVVALQSVAGVELAVIARLQDGQVLDLAIDTIAVSAQPLASITITLYVPNGWVIEAVVATIVLLLFNQEIKVEPVAPLMLTLAVPVMALQSVAGIELAVIARLQVGQVEALVMDTKAVSAQPLPSITITE